MSPFKTYVDDFVQRFVQNGLYDINLEWARRLNRDLYQVNKYTMAKTTDPITLNLDISFGIFVLYIGCCAISLTVFVVEFCSKLKKT